MLKLNLTPRELDLMLLALSLGTTVYEMAEVDEEGYDPDYEMNRMHKKILNLIENSEYKNHVKRHKGLTSSFLIPTYPILGPDEDAILEKYNTDTMIQDLIIALGKRDMREAGDGELLFGPGELAELSLEEFEARDEAMDRYYAKYEDEFEKSGLQNLRIVKSILIK